VTTAVSTPPRHRTIADLVRDLGDIPLDRIRMHPAPGTATVEDVASTKGCELVEGTLVEKAMGLKESMLAMFIGRVLDDFIRPRNLGMIVGEQGTLEILSDLVRAADIAFISWDRFPNRRIPDEPIPALAPDLAVEVVSRGNTPREMARKRREYFTAGVRLVWMIDPATRTAAAYTSETDFRTLTEADTLDGGAVLPGFALPVRDVFAELDRHG
jgi:Uma2 family endonuclease